MKLRAIPLAVAALLVLSFFSTGRAQATGSPVDQGARAAVSSSLAIKLATDSISTAAVIPHVAQNRVLINRAVVTPVNDIMVVTFPISEMTRGSNISIALDSLGKVVQTGETHIREVSATSGYVTSWRDGQLLVDKFISSEDVDRANSDRFTVTGKGLKPFDFNKFNNCLSSAGVSSLIVSITGISCGVPEPVTKIICIVGLGVTAATAWACFRVAVT